MLDPLSVNGEPPAIVGLPCDELMVSEYWHQGELIEPANVVYLRFAGRWHRLYFDFGIVFWRPHEFAPDGADPSEENLAYPLIDLGQQMGVRGVILDRLEAEPIVGGSEVQFTFRNGVRLTFSNVADTTTYRAESSSAAERSRD